MVETSPRQEETLLVNLRSGQHGVDSQKPRCLETPPPLLGRGPRVATMPIRRLDGPTLQGYPGRIIPILLVCTTPLGCHSVSLGGGISHSSPRDRRRLLAASA